MARRPTTRSRKKKRHLLWWAPLAQLAAAREKEHPADAAPIYLKQSEAALVATHNGRYDDSIELLAKAAGVMKRMNQNEEFVRHLEALRVQYKRKRNFIKLVEKRRKSLYLS